MGGLRAYALGAAAAVAVSAGYLYFDIARGGSLERGHPSGWVIILLACFELALGAIGGLLGFFVAARLEPRHSRGLSLAQGITAALAPLAANLVIGPVYDLLAEIALWAVAGAVSALFLFGLYLIARTIVRRGAPDHA